MGATAADVCPLLLVVWPICQRPVLCDVIKGIRSFVHERDLQAENQMEGRSYVALEEPVSG